MDFVNPHPLLDVSLLGGMRLIFAGSPVPAALSARQQALLAFIFLKAGFPISRTEMAFLFWPDTTEQQAHANLRNLLHRLRKRLEWLDEIINFDGGSLTWKAHRTVRLDVLDFEQAAESARGLDELQQAAKLYAGDFLPGFYEAWALDRRKQLRRRYQGVLDRLSDALENAGQYGEAIQVAYRLVDEFPLEEISYHRLMRLQRRVGDLAAVFRTYKTCADALERELGVAPSKETQGLLEQLVDQAAQVSPAAQNCGNLPMLLGGLIGRQSELDEICLHLAQHRLITLTGFGGVGKTRLALAAARFLVDRYPNGAWWLDLAPIREPAHVAIALAEMLGLPVHSEMDLFSQLVAFLSDKRILLVADNCEHLLEAAARLFNRLAQGCPNLHILATSRVSLGLPGERVLAIQPLSVPPPGSAWSQRSRLESNDSLRLFIERAGASCHDFQLDAQNYPYIVEICRRLDGLPLALEMAAARMRLLTPRQLAARLDDALSALGSVGAAAPHRHQNMQSVLAWSYELLSACAQLHLRRLAVFAGSFDLAAFEAICTEGSSEALNALAALVDHSLVNVRYSEGAARYQLHELTRQFCLEKVRLTGELDEAQACHLKHFSRLASEANAHLHGEKQIDWLCRLDAESDNFQAALHWALERDAPDPVRLALGLVGDLWFYWFYRGRYIEGLQWSEEALNAAQKMGFPDGGQVGALNSAASFTYFMGDFSASARYANACRIAACLDGDIDGVILADHHLGLLAFHGAVPGAAEIYLDEGLELARQQGKSWLIAIMLNDLGNAALEAGDWETAERLFIEDLEISRQASNFFNIYYAYLNLTMIKIAKNHLIEAKAYNQEAMRIAEITQDVRAVGLSRLHAGHIESLSSSHVAAEAAFREALKRLWDIRDRENTLECLEGLASCLLHREQFERATRLLATASAWRSRLQMHPLPEMQAAIDAHCDHLRQRMGENDFLATWNSGAWLSLEDAVRSIENF